MGCSKTISCKISKTSGGRQGVIEGFLEFTSHGGRFRWEGKYSCQAASVKASANPMRSSEARMPFRISPTLGQREPTGHWIQGTQ